jgi:integrase/recombinase XerD
VVASIRCGTSSVLNTSAQIERASDDLLRVAVGANPARYRGLSPAHTESELHVVPRWCAEQEPDPLPVRRIDAEPVVRWLHEVRRFKPSTLSRPLSGVICFYRTGVIDAILEHTPAAYLRRPSVPARRPH